MSVIRSNVAKMLLIMVLAGSGSADVWAHPGPDPLSHWVFAERFVRDEILVAQQGPDVPLAREYLVGESPLGEHLDFWGLKRSLVLAAKMETAAEFLPEESFTVTAWVTVDRPQEYGGILGVLQDNGNSEKGWVLGYNRSRFYFGLATTGSDDGDGRMTYLTGRTRHEKHRFYYVTATYDGREMRLYVNGALEAADSTSQSGPILYPEQAAYVMAGYRDTNEDHPHVGALRSVAVYDLVAKPQWVQQQYAAKQPADGGALVKAVTEDYVVKPYLQYVTQNSIIVKWETAKPSIGRVDYGETTAFESEKTEGQAATIHEVKLDELRPETQYFYRVWPKTARRTRPGDTYTFQTANRPETPFAFAILSDTQTNPKVAGTVAKHAWGQRPNFCLHAGDLVGTGSNKQHWVEHFFPSVHELISRVALIPVLGNHEENARHYYEYMALPDPEYYYEFVYGNAHFFMIDSNKKLDPGSEQYRWLDRALGRSQATWKFVCHHHPPYSSDENDYGDLWSGKSTRGDLKARQLAALYDKHGVDIVWNGHIHSYERTWPVRDDKVVSNIDVHGTVYMVVGGGGGGLETPGPTRPFFQNTVRRTHHYCMVAINGRTLEFRAFDLENRLFDHMTIVKK